MIHEHLSKIFARKILSCRTFFLLFPNEMQLGHQNTSIELLCVHCEVLTCSNWIFHLLARNCQSFLFQKIGDSLNKLLLLSRLYEISLKSNFPARHLLTKHIFSVFLEPVPSSLSRKPETASTLSGHPVSNIFCTSQTIS